MVTGTWITVTTCFLACFLLVAAELRNWPTRRGIFKIVASSAFVILAIQLGATTSSHGRLILAALILSCIGDIFLLSRRDRFFMIGIAGFLVSHIVFSITFACQPHGVPALLAAFTVMACIGIVVLRWLWGHLVSFYRVAVTAYVVAIMAMCSFAIALSVSSGNWIVAIGALAFAASDISVARDRFVSPGFVNRAWGLPLYYAAQITFAFSVGGFA